MTEDARMRATASAKRAILRTLSIKAHSLRRLLYCR
jgi:hypothetical protein